MPSPPSAPLTSWNPAVADVFTRTETTPVPQADYPGPGHDSGVHLTPSHLHPESRELATSIAGSVVR